MSPDTDLIVVVTCPTLRPQYLAATLAALDEAGATKCRRLVVSDGPMTVDCQWPCVVKPDGPSGTRHGMWFAFREALKTDATRILYCEDDLIVSAGAVDKILSHEIPDDAAMLNFFDQKPEVRSNREGWHRVPAMGRNGRGLWGTLCVLYPRRTVGYLAARDPDEYDHPWRKGKNAGDCIVSWALERSPWPEYLMQVPSLVDHAGDQSSTGHARVRRARWYAEGTPSITCAICRELLDDDPVEIPGGLAHRAHLVGVT